MIKWITLPQIKIKTNNDTTELKNHNKYHNKYDRQEYEYCSEPYEHSI